MIAYMTGTFDGLHQGQIEMLKTARTLLPPETRLIIGLTTDELAARQKRVPTQDYEQRRSVLMELPYIDAVMSHNGETKQEAHQRIHFDYLVTGAEYRGTEEYSSMEDTVKVIYVNCPTARKHSSSKFARRQTIANAAQITVVKDGTAGLVYLFDVKPSPLLIKTVRISEREFSGSRTANVYNLPVPNPRNLKRLGETHCYPNLPGVNGYREIDVQRLIMEFPWCDTLQVIQVYQRNEGAIHAEQDDYQHLNMDKSDAREIYFIHQFHSGMNLLEWVNSQDDDDTIVDVMVKVITEVRRICTEDLQQISLVHGDIHPENICIKPRPLAENAPVIPGQDTEAVIDYDVKLIDFGWCLHRSFILDDQERPYYEECLASQWDLTHFLDSVRYYFSNRSWFGRLEASGVLGHPPMRPLRRAKHLRGW